MEPQLILLILSASLGFAGTVVSSMVLFNLRSMNARLTVLEADHKKVAQRKTECQRDFVSSEQWVRSETYTRNKLDRVNDTLASLSSRFDVVEKLPDICGNMIAQTVKHMKEPTNNG